ncbi:hypothetical protein NliqN6_0519 [Naganishia liquefaciens]|uniref:Nucleotide-diphospho-sugar transferase n=1 Tax=Naganishia liquefaciens TaxID=104408 RepID=A0A8H3YDA8_9TREE|nr:hypothetical protein NliqN6_0519 [Naganishia liquefaciens]
MAFVPTKRKANVLKWVALILVVLLAGIVFAITRSPRWFPFARELYHTHRKPVGIWVPPPALQYRPNRNAIISSVWTVNDTVPAAVLGHSISRWTSAIYEEGGLTAESCATVDMLLMHLPGAIEKESRERLEQIGWKLSQVDLVQVPRDTPRDRKFGFTKFRVFGLTEYDHILLLDSNTLVVSRDVYNIFDNDLDFAGVAARQIDRSVHQPIDSGVLYYRPSQDLAQFALSKVNSTEYPHKMGEQSLIGTFMRYATTHLPIEWNVRLESKKAWLNDWRSLQSRFKILQYTVPNSFLEDRNAYNDTIEKDEVSLWWRIRSEMESLHMP